MTSPVRRPVDLRPISVAMVTTYPPTKCGIGRFSSSLCEAWRRIAPKARIRIARIATTADAFDADPRVEVMFDPSSAMAARHVARAVNDTDAVVIQHEFGLYGPDDGIAVLDLADRIEVPLVSVLHTVRPHPTHRQRQIVEELGRRGHLIVMSKVARSQLLAAHDVDPAVVSVIPHGSVWSPTAPPPTPRRRLITWGLLGPGKGIERALHALARVRLEPPVTYDIVGQTHPKVLARSGQAYRRSLEDLAADLGVQDQVRFIDRYVDDFELASMAASAAAVVIPYDNDEQVCSGVLTDAIAIGRPVIATAFPHATELAPDCGRVVDRDPKAMAAAITELLTDDAAYTEAAGMAQSRGQSFAWTRVAAAYLDLLHDVRARSVVA